VLAQASSGLAELRDQIEMRRLVHNMLLKAVMFTLVTMMHACPRPISTAALHIQHLADLFVFRCWVIPLFQDGNALRHKAATKIISLFKRILHRSRFLKVVV
jgi:hypothetical protein